VFSYGVANAGLGDTTRSIVACYLEVACRQIQLDPVRIEQTMLPVKAVEYAHAPVLTGEKVEMKRFELDSGWVFCFLNVPPGTFTLKKLHLPDKREGSSVKQTQIEPPSDYKINVAPSSFHFLGSRRVLLGGNLWEKQEPGSSPEFMLRINLEDPGGSRVPFMVLEHPTERDVLLMLQEEIEDDWSAVLNERLSSLDRKTTSLEPAVAPSAESSTKLTITGTVKKKDGSPLASNQVSIFPYDNGIVYTIHPDGRIESIDGTTDAFGRFSIDVDRTRPRFEKELVLFVMVSGNNRQPAETAVGGVAVFKFDKAVDRFEVGTIEVIGEKVVIRKE
jgi:hypothetical protein